MKAKLQLAKGKLLKDQMEDVSSTADANEISEPLVDNAVDDHDHDLVKPSQAELQKLQSVVKKCVYDRLKVLKMNEKAECALSFFQRLLGNFDSRSCKRKRRGGSHCGKRKRERGERVKETG
ncbi:hypothetical protein MKX01_018308 [Papaver californicum]|nr:hypothetical protein MKX01_018308 [Papaver californicum]